jgi:two-component system phosphate regulon sensor histidine kinase PhoR
MTRFRFVSSRFWLLGGVALLPLLAVLGALVGYGHLRALPAIVILTAAVGGLLIVVRGIGGELRAAAGDLDSLRPGASGAVPAALSQAAILGDAIDRLRGELAAERRRGAQQLAAAGTIVDSLPDPLLMLDAERRVVRANEAARALIGMDVVGHDLALALRHPAVLDVVDAALRGRAGGGEVDFALPGPRPRELSARVVALPSPAAEDAVAILILHDLTTIKRTEQMRADFVANASHELRTPLATLLGFIETLRGPARDDAAARERFLAIMQEQAERMARLIRDLLSLSQIELNEHTPPQGRVDIVATVRSVADMLQMQARAKNTRILVEAAEALPPAIGDRDELIQVFQNLIDNAIKYGRPDSDIRVTIRAAGPPPTAGGVRGAAAALAVAVADQGEGIPREHLSRLTERFYRVDSARSRALGGTGLGLAIVKHIVNRHRGALTIESTPGQGSTFTVSLPAAESAAEWAARDL